MKKKIFCGLALLCALIVFFGCRPAGQTSSETSAPLSKPEKITAISCGNSFNLFLTDNGEVYGVGVNQLSAVEAGRPQELEKPVRLNIKEWAAAIKAGDVNTVIFTEQNNLLLSGADFFREADPWKTTQTYSERVVLPFSHGAIKEVAVGGWHMLVLTRDGEVYTYGSNAAGQLGLERKEARGFERVPFEQKIMQIGASDRYSVFLDEKGDLYGCGAYFAGLFDYEPREKPVKPGLLMTGVKSVCGGYEKLLTLGEDGVVSSLNWQETEQARKLTKLRFGDDEKIEWVKTGIYSHSVAMSASGQLYYWGDNTTGNIPALPKEKISTPRKWQAPMAFDELYVGSPGIIFKDKADGFYAYGWNGNGLLAVPGKEIITEPVKITVDMLLRGE